MQVYNLLLRGCETTKNSEMFFFYTSLGRGRVQGQMCLDRCLTCHR